MAHSEHSQYQEEFPDAHPHEYDHSEPRYSMIAILFGTTVILLIVVGIGIQLYYERTEQSLIYNRVLSQPNWVLMDLRKKEQQELTNYGYHDKEKGMMRMPIDKAMKMVMEESASGAMKFPTTAYAVKTPEQLAAAATPAVSKPGADAAAGAQTSGVTSSPNVQGSSVSQQEKQ